MQVVNMRFIYEKASCVLAWLGEVGPSTNVAIRFVHERQISYRDFDDSNSYKTSAVSSVSEDIGAGIQDLCARPWVSRAWVQQEVFLACRLTIH